MFIIKVYYKNLMCKKIGHSCSFWGQFLGAVSCIFLGAVKVLGAEINENIFNFYNNF